MLHAKDEAFIRQSHRFADMLTNAQNSTTAPDGILAIISGRVGSKSLPFLTVVKAETQDGFRASEQNNFVGLEYISELFLTQSQRFYKVGCLVEISSQKPHEKHGYSPTNYRVFLFDHLIQGNDISKAATYFYSTFLGMSKSSSSKQLTKDFYEFTQRFIDTTDLDIHEKTAIHEALRVELRNQSAIVNVASFGQSHMPSDDLRQQYEKHMKDQGFPQNAISKDTGYIDSRLRRRRQLRFTTEVQISAPPEQFQDLVKVEPDSDPNFTLVRIKGTITGQS